MLLGSTSTTRRLFAATSKRFAEPRLGELIAHVAARQSEFALAVIADFRKGRFSAATAVVRSLFETTVWIAWPFTTPDEDQQRKRLVRLLLQAYRDARNSGATLPADVLALLAHTTGKAARKPPDFKDVLRQADELERKTEGGKEYWQSHAANWEWGSRHVHPSLVGSYLGPDAAVENERVGINALVYGHQYLALAGVTCAIAADVADLKLSVEKRYASVADLQQREIDRLSGGSADVGNG